MEKNSRSPYFFGLLQVCFQFLLLKSMSQMHMLLLVGCTGRRPFALDIWACCFSLYRCFFQTLSTLLLSSLSLVPGSVLGGLLFGLNIYTCSSVVSCTIAFSSSFVLVIVFVFPLFWNSIQLLVRIPTLKSPIYKTLPKR